jgi:2-(1,2-epoxy-1,2-dihydrophenyl)acetyl-CoA isomerase
VNTLELDIGGEVAVVRLNRPEARNAINNEMVDELEAAVDAVLSSEARALVIAANGPTFCAGADLGMVQERFGETAATEAMMSKFHDLVRLLRRLQLPTVSAVEGAAAGAGIALALVTDFCVVGRSARLVPAYLRIGMTPDGGVSYFLTRALGGARTMRLMIRNETLGADALSAAGLADLVVDDGAALDAACGLAAEVAGAPPAALANLRALVDAAPTHDLGEQLDSEAASVVQLLLTDDYREGVEAFKARRRPEFSSPATTGARMAQHLDAADRLQLEELVARYVFIVDDGDWDRLDEVFTPDATCDFTDVVPTMPVMEGIPAIRECFSGMEHPVGHYVTGTIIEPGDDGSVLVRTKQVAVLRGGKLLLAEYRDRAVRTDDGWRFAERRTVRPRAYRKQD